MYLQGKLAKSNLSLSEGVIKGQNALERQRSRPTGSRGRVRPRLSAGYKYLSSGPRCVFAPAAAPEVKNPTMAAAKRVCVIGSGNW